MKQLGDGRVQMTMSRHIQEEKALNIRDRLISGYLTTGSTYHVQRGWIGWKVVKRWFLHENGNQILGSPKKG